MSNLVNLEVDLVVNKEEGVEPSPFDVDEPLELGKVYEALEDIKKEVDDSLGLFIPKGSHVKVYQVNGNTFRVIYEVKNQHNQVKKVVAMNVEGNLKRFKEIGICDVYGLEREVEDTGDTDNT